jgi:hypothetical protein
LVAWEFRLFIKAWPATAAASRTALTWVRREGEGGREREGEGEREQRGT